MANAFVGQAWVQVSPSFQNFQSEATKGIVGPMQQAGTDAGNAASEGLNKAGPSFGKVATAIASSLVVSKITDFGKSVIQAASDARVANKDLTQAFANAGDATGKFADHAIKLAESLGRSIGVSPTVIKQAEGILATFQNVSSETAVTSGVFDRATKAAADLAAAGFGDLESNAKSLGKALNDPIKYMGTLARSGIALTASQQDNIKAMVKQGDLLGAQRTLLGYVEERVGGMAAKTATGGAKMSVTFEELKVKLGQGLLPAVGKVFGVFSDFFGFVADHSTVFTPIIIALGVFAVLMGIVNIVNTIAALTINGVTLGSIAAAAATWLWNAALTVWNILMSPVTLTIGLIVLAILALVAVVILIWKNWDTIWHAIAAAMSWVWNTVLKPVFDAIKGAIQWVIDLFMGPWGQAIALALAVFMPFIGIPLLIFKNWSTIVGFFQTLWAGIVVGVQWLWGIVSAVFGALLAVWNAVAAGIAWAWTNILLPVFTVMKDIVLVFLALIILPLFLLVQATWNAMCVAIDWAWNNILLPVWNAIAAVFTWLWGAVLSPIINAIVAAWNFLGAAIAWAVNTLIVPAWNFMGAVFNVLWGIVQAIINAFVAAWNFLGSVIALVWNSVILVAWNALMAVLNFLWNGVVMPIFTGIQTAWNAVGSAISFVWNSVISPVFDAIKGGLDLLGKAFEGAKNFIASVWDALKDAVAGPVRWVAFSIINPLIRGANILLDKIGLAVPEIPAFAEGGRIPGGWGGGDRQLIMAEPGEWVLTKRQAKAIGYGNLANLPHYKEGGGIGISPHLGLPHISAPGWMKKAGHFIASGAEDIWHLGEDVVSKVSGLLRYAAYKAFEALTLPIRKLLEDASDIDPPLFFTGAIAKFGLTTLDKLLDFIRGKSESDAGSEIAEAVVAEAERQLGKPYVWGARGPNAFDCSGLVDWSFGTAPGSPNIGWTGPRVGPTTEQQQGLGRPVSGGDVTAGDLVFFGQPVHHVGIAYNDHDMINAPHTGAVVRKEPIWGGEPHFFRKLVEAAMNVGPGAGDAVTRWTPVVQAALNLLHQPATSDFINSVLIGIKNESGGNPNATNNWDSNARAGTPSQGLLQVIGPTFAAYHVPGTANSPLDPLANIAAAINYAIHRYGSWANVPGVRNVLSGGRWVGYDAGGWLPPGPSLTFNDTGKPEPILTSAQWDAIARTNTVVGTAGVGADGATGRSGPAVVLNNPVFSDEVDVEVLLRKAAWHVSLGAI